MDGRSKSFQARRVSVIENTEVMLPTPSEGMHGSTFRHHDPSATSCACREEGNHPISDESLFIGEATGHRAEHHAIPSRHATDRNWFEQC